MKKLLFVGLLCSQFVTAQRHEVGVKIGSSNLVGDIGSTKYLQFASEGMMRTSPSIGISYKRNFNPYQGVKLSFSSHSVYFNDSFAKETYRNLRNIEGSNNILEGSITFEYNFFPINNELKESIWSPYIFAGIAGIAYDSPSIDYVVEKVQSGYRVSPIYENYRKRFSGAIPFGIGLKYKFNYNWAIYGEITFRPTLTDELDYNNIEKYAYTVSYQDIPEIELPEAEKTFNNFIENNKVGNLKSKDWLNSISLGISYSFGRPPCYCD